MKKEFCREQNCNYLVIYGNGFRMDYQCRMITDNHPSHFLKAFFRRQDQDVKMYYDITSCQPLTQICERKKLGKDQLLLLMRSIKAAYDQALDYLLDVDRIDLSPDMIYMDTAKDLYLFCFAFSKATTLEEDLRELFRFCLDHISVRDFEGVGIGYSLYSNSEKNMPFPELFELFEESLPKHAQIKEEEIDEKKINAKEINEKEVNEGQLNEEQIKVAKIRPQGPDLRKEYQWKEMFCRSELMQYFSLRVLFVSLLLAGAWIYYDRFILQGTGGSRLFMGAVLFAGSFLAGTVWVCWQHKNRSSNQKDQAEEDLEELPLFSEKICLEEDMSQTERPEFLTELLEPLQKQEGSWCLRSLQQEREGDIFLKYFPFAIGKMPENDHVLTGKGISRYHACFLMGPGKDSMEAQIILKDLNSTNGCFINKRRLEPYEQVVLQEGDLVTLADQIYELIWVAN